MIETFSSNFFL